MKNQNFEEYFVRYRNLVIKIAAKKVGDYQTAQEICQQVFLNLYGNMDKVSPDLVKAWLIRCTSNAVVDHFRKINLQRELMAAIAVSGAGAARTEESVELLVKQRIDQELAGRILKEVRRTNEQWYEVLMLCCVEELPYGEAAKRLRIPEAVLRARMYRARMFVKERFGSEYLK